MKQCPSCNEVFEEQKAFCDMDGSALVDQTDVLREVLNDANRPTGSSSAWVTGAIGGFIGAIVCVLLYIGFLAPSSQDFLDQDRRDTQAAQTQPAKSGQMAAAPMNSQMPAVETATPTESETPAETAPSPADGAATATTQLPPAALNTGPIATGGKLPAGGGERAIIKMKDGSLVEADAAWEDAQGVWFRRSGLVSFVEKSRVEAITEPQKRPATPEAKTP